MLACVTEAATAYHVPVLAIQRVMQAAKGGSGIGPMGIPAAWMPVLGTYGFPERRVRSQPCWGVAAGAWILAVESLYAVNRFSGGTPVYPTRLGNIPSQDIRWANAASSQTGVPAALILAVAAQESGFDPDAVSDKGAQGLMQFMPGTAARFGLRNPFDPKAAIFAGARYLRVLYQELGSWKLALAGYNAGERSVVDAGYHIPPFRQTQKYVPDVLAHYQQIAGQSK